MTCYQAQAEAVHHGKHRVDRVEMQGLIVYLHIPVAHGCHLHDPYGHIPLHQDDELLGLQTATLTAKHCAPVSSALVGLSLLEMILSHLNDKESHDTV